jgi:hypothetical protein
MNIYYLCPQKFYNIDTRKLASQAASPASRVENEFLRLGRRRTRMDRRVPMRPKRETEVCRN